MTRVAIPIFQNRVSPVFDTCLHMLLIIVEHNREVGRENVFLGEMPLSERCDIIQKMNVAMVICGGVSETFARMLTGSNIRLCNGIAGNVDEVIQAFLENRIHRPRFYMPGFSPQKAKPFHRKR